MEFEELIRLFKAFFKKSNETNFLNAIKVSHKYLTNKQSLYNFKYSYNYSNFAGDHKEIFINPLISIIVVSYNSGEDLKELFDSINKQTYKKIELILVENGTEKTDSYLKELDIPTKYVTSENIGFAAANNLAFEHSNGDYICLVNPDTVLKENVIEQLLLNLKLDKKTVISVPKIVFYKKFFDIEITSNMQFNIDTNSLVNSLNYKKYFIRSGNKIINENQFAIFSDNKRILLSLPIDQSNISLKIRKAVINQTFAYRINDFKLKDDSIIQESNKKDFFKLKIDTSNNSLIIKGKNIINNAGSGLKNKSPYDRGFGDYDLGHFNNSEYIDAFCGCVAMISPKVFTKRKIFIDEFFAYYEDSELSNWIQKRKFKIRYSPTALVMHKHSTATSEGSILWNTFVTRSKTLYDKLVYKKVDKNYVKNEYLNIPNELSKILEKYDINLKGKSREKLLKKNRPSAAIYNTFWTTMGGGERHALAVAKLISKTHDIYLLSEYDFDEKRLKEYFSINFKFRKIINTINSELTESFDLFINSSFCSSLIPKSKDNIYLVSFPHQVQNKNFLKEYYFLHNSNFTKKWATKYWGKHRNSVLFPILELNRDNEDNDNKVRNFKFNNNKKNIISIGRFTVSGHAKRQDFILKAFSEAQKSFPSDFNLFLVGSLDYSNNEDISFFEDLKEQKIKNVYIFPNLEYYKLQELLSISRFYVQATGVFVNHKKQPHKMEHFGISVIEAMLFGNYPITYNIGGPAETIELLKIGETFHNLKSLIKIFLTIMKDYNHDKYFVKKDFLSELLEKNNQTIKIFENLLIKNNKY